MTESIHQRAMELATDIVVAYVAQQSIQPPDLVALIREVRNALVDGSVVPSFAAAAAESAPPGAGEAAHGRGDTVPRGDPTPAVPVEQSVTPDYLISLEDGRAYRSLKRHLMARYGMSPDDYRQKWGLPADYPMVAPNYSAERSKVAKRIGLGGARPAAKAPRRA